MKTKTIKIVKSQGVSEQEVDEQLEKALKDKRKATEARYAKESYHDDRLNAFHDLVMDRFQKELNSLQKELTAELKHKLKV